MSEDPWLAVASSLFRPGQDSVYEFRLGGSTVLYRCPGIGNMPSAFKGIKITKIKTDKKLLLVVRNEFYKRLAKFLAKLYEANGYIRFEFELVDENTSSLNEEQLKDALTLLMLCKKLKRVPLKNRFYFHCRRSRKSKNKVIISIEGQYVENFKKFIEEKIGTVLVFC